MKRKKESRNQVVTIKCSKAEKKKIQSLASKADLPVSSYCLNKAVRKRTGIREKHDRDILAQAVRILTAQNNLEEQLRAAGISYTIDEIRKELLQLWDICRS